MNELYEHGSLTEELLRLLPSVKPSLADLLNGSLPYIKRFNQMHRAYGDVALSAMEEAASIKYSGQPQAL